MKKILKSKTLTDGELSIRFERDRYSDTEKVARGNGYKMYKYRDRLLAEIRGKYPRYVRIFKHRHVSIGRCDCSLCEWRRKRTIQHKTKKMNEKAEALGEW